MKYYEIDLTLTPCTQDAQDVLSALLGDAGCESFEETPAGLKAYIQQQFYDDAVLAAVVEAFPFDSTHIIYKVREAEDRDWNEQWEQEGFEPIVISSEWNAASGKRSAGIIIHDGRHLPADAAALGSVSPCGVPSDAAVLGGVNGSPLLIEIDAHLAFGTGTHETTRMICATLLQLPLEGQRVLDCGSGTGILGICALKLGAASCLSYDIDEWSADNTRHNAVINHVDDRLTALCGDSSVLSGIAAESPAGSAAPTPASSPAPTPAISAATTPAGSPAGSPAGFSLVLANINRNILLQDMPRFVSVMAPGATLILSGFYENDCALLESKAQSLGLTLTATKTDGDWACMVFSL